MYFRCVVEQVYKCRGKPFGSHFYYFIVFIDLASPLFSFFSDTSAFIYLFNNAPTIHTFRPSLATKFYWPGRSKPILTNQKNRVKWNKHVFVIFSCQLPAFFYSRTAVSAFFFLHAQFDNVTFYDVFLMLKNRFLSSQVNKCIWKTKNVLFWRKI